MYAWLFEKLPNFIPKSVPFPFLTTVFFLYRMLLTTVRRGTRPEAHEELRHFYVVKKISLIYLR